LEKLKGYKIRGPEVRLVGMDWKFLIDQQESSSKLRFIKWNKIRKISRSRNIKIRIFL
jgi:hypothetical protein